MKQLEKAGFEADDIIGTLARVCEEEGFRVVMVTGDKDFRQLITTRTSMWDPMKDVVTDYPGVKERYGLEPALFVDVMGLSGDSTDNIPACRAWGRRPPSIWSGNSGPSKG